MAEKKRLDTVLVELGFAETRSKATALIMSGEVFVNGQKETKAGYSVKESDKIEFKGKKMPFVSRGGYKLEKANQRIFCMLGIRHELRGNPRGKAGMDAEVHALSLPPIFS